MGRKKVTFSSDLIGNSCQALLFVKKCLRLAVDLPIVSANWARGLFDVTQPGFSYFIFCFKIYFSRPYLHILFHVIVLEVRFLSYLLKPRRSVLNGCWKFYARVAFNDNLAFTLLLSMCSSPASSFICETFRRMYMKFSDVVYPKWQINNDYFDVQIYVLLGVF